MGKHALILKGGANHSVILPAMARVFSMLCSYCRVYLYLYPVSTVYHTVRYLYAVMLSYCLGYVCKLIILQFPDFSNILCDFPWLSKALTGKYPPIFQSEWEPCYRGFLFEYFYSKNVIYSLDCYIHYLFQLLLKIPSSFIRLSKVAEVLPKNKMFVPFNQDTNCRGPVNQRTRIFVISLNNCSYFQNSSFFETLQLAFVASLCNFK